MSSAQTPSPGSLDGLLGTLHAAALSGQEWKVLGSMERNGTLTEPTNFTYPDLVEFYDNILKAVRDYDAYRAEYPNNVKTIGKRKEIISTNIPIVEFHAAWCVLNFGNGGESHIPAEEFKKMEPKTRQEMFVSAMETKKNQLHGLYETRQRAISLCIERGILPPDYK